MKTLPIIPILFIFLACQQELNNNNAEFERLKAENDSLRIVLRNEDKPYENKLIKAIRENDSSSFFEASQYMLEQGKLTELFFYAFIMFMEYNDFQGAMHTYFILGTYTGQKWFDSHKMIMFENYIVAKMNEMKGKSYIPDLIKDSSGNVLTSEYFLDQMKIDKIKK